MSPRNWRLLISLHRLLCQLSIFSNISKSSSWLSGSGRNFQIWWHIWHRLVRGWLSYSMIILESTRWPFSHVAPTTILKNFSLSAALPLQLAFHVALILVLGHQLLTCLGLFGRYYIGYSIRVARNLGHQSHLHRLTIQWGVSLILWTSFAILKLDSWHPCSSTRWWRHNILYFNNHRFFLLLVILSMKFNSPWVVCALRLLQNLIFLLIFFNVFFSFLGSCPLDCFNCISLQLLQCFWIIILYNCIRRVGLY